MSEDDDIAMMIWNSCMWKYSKRIFAVIYV